MMLLTDGELQQLKDQMLCALQSVDEDELARALECQKEAVEAVGRPNQSFVCPVGHEFMKVSVQIRKWRLPHIHVIISLYYM